MCELDVGDSIISVQMRYTILIIIHQTRHAGACLFLMPRAIVLFADYAPLEIHDDSMIKAIGCRDGRYPERGGLAIRKRTITYND